MAYKSKDDQPISDSAVPRATEAHEGAKSEIESHKESSSPSRKSETTQSSGVSSLVGRKRSRVPKTNNNKEILNNKRKNSRSSRKSIASENVTEIFSNQFTEFEIFKSDFVKSIVDYTKEPEADDIRTTIRHKEKEKERDSSFSSVESETKSKNFEEEEIEEIDPKKFACKHFGQSDMLHNILMVSSKNGSLRSILKLLRRSFLFVDRVMLTTEYGCFVILRRCSWCQKRYLVANACAKNVNAFRQLAFCCDTEYPNVFKNLRSTVSYLMDVKQIKKNLFTARKDFIIEFMRVNTERNLTSNEICL